MPLDLMLFSINCDVFCCHQIPVKRSKVLDLNLFQKRIDLLLTLRSVINLIPFSPLDVNRQNILKFIYK